VKSSVEAQGSSHNEDFRLEEFLPYRLSVAAEVVSRLVVTPHLAKAGLSMPEWRLLASIGRFGVLSPTAAGEKTSMDKVKVSRAALSLVARGLLRQSQDPQDGRGRLLRLTRKGTASYATVASTARNIEASLTAGLTKGEMSALHKALGKLNDHTQTLLANSKDSPAD
jgi:DNA-binding MarR family transcriptional regulator